MTAGEPAAPRFQAGDRIGAEGRFRIEARIGGGGFGEVYKAWDSQLRDWVALKRLTRESVPSEDRRRRVIAEARRARSLKHPSIVTIYDVFEHDGEAIIVQELAHGRPLSERIGRPYALGEFFRFAEPCVAALVHAAETGVVHCDLKPENIMVGDDGMPRILDFGTARRVLEGDATSAVRTARSTEPSATSEEITPRGGTPGYVAPEIVLGDAPDPRADIYSLGVVFYEMLAGANPFARETSSATLLAQVEGDVRPPSVAAPAVPPALDAVVLRMIARRPADRYASARDAARDLAAARDRAASGVERPHDVGGGAGAAAGAGARTSRQLSRRTSRRRIAALVTAAVLLVAALWAIDRFVTRAARESGMLGDGASLVAPPRGAASGARRDDGAGAGYGYGVIAAASVPLLAIEPFRCLAVDTTTLFFAHGMTEALKARLAAIEGLYVVDAESQPGAEFLLAGTLQRANEQLRITYVIDDVRLGHKVGGGVAEERVENLFALQDSVASRVASLLATAIGLDLRAGSAPRPTTDAVAYAIYLEARGCLRGDRDRRNIELAIATFERALARDPGFALALAGLGEAYWRLYEVTRRQEWATKAEEIALEALEKGPGLAEVRITLGTIAIGRGKPELAEREFRRALEISPGSAVAYRGLAETYEGGGDVAAAESTFLRAIAARPDDWAGHHELGVFYSRYGRFDEALARFHRVVEIMPANALEHSNIGGINAYLGRPDSAIASYERSIALRPTPEALSNLATLERSQGRYAEAVAHYERARALSPSDYVIQGNLAATLFLIPERDADARGAVQKALALAEPLLEVNPSDALLLADIAQFYASLPETVATRRYAERALALEPEEGEVLCGVSFALERIGDREGAIAAAVRALGAGHPPDAWRSEAVARALIADPRFEAAAARAATNGAPGDSS